ncbi:MAG TPA: HEAT repeat domain-containing protein [Spirochaetia bacterium]|nr:HEAT repeat domain-containing protein [Spirochaetia bacterium]
MMLKKMFAMALAGTLCAVPVAFAQNGGNTGREESIEELYLTNPALQIAYEAARSDDRESKLLALSQLTAMIDEGVSKEEEVQIAAILRDLASQGTTIIIREKGRLVNYYVDVRREACRVLATVKSDEAKKRAVAVLIEVLKYDDDPIVKSNAAYSLGVIGLNENEESARAIARALESQDYVAPNDHFAYSGAIALEKIAKANNGIFDPLVMQVLVKITQGNYNRSVKDKAFSVLQTLRTYSR